MTRYTNAVLTVIAACLVVLVWQQTFPTRSAWAQEQQAAPSVQRVVITGIQFDDSKGAAPVSPIKVQLMPVTDPVPVWLKGIAESGAGDFIESGVATTNARNQSIKANALRVAVR